MESQVGDAAQKLLLKVPECLALNFVLHRSSL